MSLPKLNSADWLLVWWAARFVAAGFALGVMAAMVIVGSP